MRLREHEGYDVRCFDRLVHAPSRLSILSRLAKATGKEAEEGVDFAFLRQETGLTGSNLTSNARLLEEAGLVKLTWLAGRRARRAAVLTADGRRRLEEHYECLDGLRPPKNPDAPSGGDADG